MDVPVGLQIILFTVYVTWSIVSIVILFRIADALGEIINILRDK